MSSLIRANRWSQAQRRFWGMGTERGIRESGVIEDVDVDQTPKRYSAHLLVIPMCATRKVYRRDM